ncbi:hypothetical protein [Zavarzinia sp. CC-PAN008]|uniref:hypothetical protein n=1 Tax=Zavarzinia sp. CC-PAN008 TaxID=3243332 RepID=UPI003F7489CB
MTKPDADGPGPDPSVPDRVLRRLFWWLVLRVAAVALLALVLQTALILNRALEPEGMDLDDEVAAKAEAVGTMLAGPLVTALAAGIPLDRLNGVEPFLASGMQGQHDLTAITLAAPDGRVLWGVGQAPPSDLVERAVGSLGTAHMVVRQAGDLVVAIPLVVGGRVQAALLVGGDPDRAMAEVEMLPLPVPAALLAALLIGLELLLLAVRLIWVRPLVTSLRILWRGSLGAYTRLELVSGRSAAALLTRALNAALVRLQLRRAFLVLLAREARDSQVDPAVRQQIDAARIEADWAMAGVPDQLDRARLVGRLAALRLAAFLAALGLGVLGAAALPLSGVGGRALLAAPAALAAVLALGVLVPPSPHVGWRALIAVALSALVLSAPLAAILPGGVVPVLAGCSGAALGLTLRSAWRRWQRVGLAQVGPGIASGLAAGVLLVPAVVAAGLADLAAWSVPPCLVPALVLWVRLTGPHAVEATPDAIRDAAAEGASGGGGHAA